jgi:PIN domain nuclease of toxin-antitoxin system
MKAFLIDTDDSKNIIYLSKVSLWEIALKISIGKLEIHIVFEDLERFLADKNFFIIDFDFEDLSIYKSLPFHHNDPFDRLIIAQAINNNFCLISNDSNFEYYNVELERT